MPADGGFTHLKSLLNWYTPETTMPDLDLPAVLAELEKCHAAMTPGEWEYLFSARASQPHTIMGPVNDGSRTSIAHTPWNRPDEEATFRGIATLRNLCPALISLLRQAQTDREENERLRDQEAGKLRGIMNGLWKFAEEECGHRGHSSRHALSTVMEWVANAKDQLTAARERIAALKRGLEYAVGWVPLCKCSRADCAICRTNALLADRAPAEGGGT